MDDELREFLTERFDTIDQRFSGIDQRFDTIDQRFSGIDQRFDTIDQRFAGIDQQFAELRRELDGRFADLRRHFDVVGEGLRVDIRLIAEGHAMLREHMDRKFSEQEGEHLETRAAIKFSYTELDRRLTRLEALTVDLEGRLSRLEQER